MMNRISYILLLSITTAISMAANVRAESQFLPEAKEKFNDFSDSNSTIYSPILECRENGYTISSCPEGSRLSKPCPYGISTGLYKECVPAASICLNKGYVLNCEEGYEADYTQRCPEDELYTKCKCNTCVGYYYSEEEANAEGYIADGEPCLSCNEKKYKRIENPCDGFEYDTTNCGVNSCGTLEGDTCQSGAILKYKDCAPCPTPACPEGTVNYDTYFCDGALRCYWPAEEPSCSQTTCFDYIYSESVTCKTGYVKKSCTDPCVGTRYKCEEQICTPTKDCSAYTLTSQTGCNNGYLSCDDGCGTTTYKCKPYAVGDEYFVNGISVGLVISVSGTAVNVASTLKLSPTEEIENYCKTLSPGSWFPPDANIGKIILDVYGESYGIGIALARLRIKSYSNENSYCITQGGIIWPKSSCWTPKLYNSCVITVQQIQ